MNVFVLCEAKTGSKAGFSATGRAEERIAPDHPLRLMRRMVGEALWGLSPRFARMYSKNRRPSIAPEKLLRELFQEVLEKMKAAGVKVEFNARATGLGYVYSSDDLRIEILGNEVLRNNLLPSPRRAITCTTFFRSPPCRKFRLGMKRSLALPRQ
jgi:hypothetical protein